MNKDAGMNEIIKERYLISIGISGSINYSTGEKVEGYIVYVLDLENKLDYQFIGEKGAKHFNSIKLALNAGKEFAANKYNYL